ncbi:MAG: SPOR domain-containing protein [Burkholderiaceae bacterium]
MLRLLVLLLVLINAGYYAWSHDMLRAYGFGPVHQEEPQRLSQQIRPDALVIGSANPQQPPPNPTAVVAPPVAASCLQAGLFDATQAQALRQRIPSVLPDGAWSLDEVVVPPRWIVYMGKFADAQAVAKKRAELVALNLPVEPLLNPAFAPGLSLGGFDSQALAQAELAGLVKRGVRTAQVVQESAESRASMLRITPVDETVRARLDDLRPMLAGKTLQPCP